MPDTLILKAPVKLHLKILSAQVICCITLYLLTLLSNVNIDANSVDFGQAAPTGQPFSYES